jgi:hypothetical protein
LPGGRLVIGGLERRAGFDDRVVDVVLRRMAEVTSAAHPISSAGCSHIGPLVLGEAVAAAGAIGCRPGTH